MDKSKKYIYISLMALVVALVIVLSVVLGITLARPDNTTSGTIEMNLGISTDTTADFPFEDKLFLPGSTISGVNLKVKVFRDSTADDPSEQDEGLAYVRCRFYSSYNDEDFSEFVHLSMGPGENWLSINDWWVLVDDNGMPRGAKNGETVTFTEGNTIKIDESLGDEFAGKSIKVTFQVETLGRSNLEPTRIRDGYWQSQSN